MRTSKLNKKASFLGILGGVFFLLLGSFLYVNMRPFQALAAKKETFKMKAEQAGVWMHSKTIYDNIIPNDQNAAPLLLTLFKQFRPEPREFHKILSKPDPKVLASYEPLFNNMQSSFDSLDTALQKPYCRFAKDFSPSTGSNIISEMAESKRLARWLLIAALIDANKKDWPSCVKHLNQVYRLAYFTAECPVDISALVAISLDNMTYHQIEKLISLTHADPGLIRELCSSLTGSLIKRDLRYWLRSSTMSALYHAELCSKDSNVYLHFKPSNDDQIGIPPKIVSEAKHKIEDISFWLVPRAYLRDSTYASTYDFFGSVYKVLSQNQTSLQQKAQALDQLAQQVKSHGATYWTPYLTADYLTDFFLSYERSKVHNEVLLEALHILELKQQSGHWPTHSKTLDRFGKGPLQYQVKEDGFILYSFGTNFIDDHGSGERREDLVFKYPMTP